ncbi:MAG: (Fe-S)-binding protein, partial [Frankiales bacterium]|nr:(Fe-S)-binding protein [Frankiales bacterium]
MRIALFVTCLADTLFPDVARATVTLLERLGHEVVVPPGQTCCGQM